MHVSDPEVAALTTSIVALLTALAGWVRARTLHEQNRLRIEQLRRDTAPADPPA